MVEDTKTLVAGAASSQEQLAKAAQNSVLTITQLSEVVKMGATSLGSPNRQDYILITNFTIRWRSNKIAELTVNLPPS